MGRLLLLISVIPVILILYFVYKKDRNKEPAPLLAKLFIFGILSCILVLIIGSILSIFVPLFNEETNNLNLVELLLYVFVFVALIEEGSKWIMVRFIGYNNKEFDEMYDIIVYSVFVSLGFACFENIGYVFLSGTALTGLAVGVLRGILAVPGHACYALYMGYFLSLAKKAKKENNKSKEIEFKIYSILVPTILHGVYDYCILSKSNILLIVFLIFVISLFVISVLQLKKYADNNTKLFMKNKFCPNCGVKIEDEYCPNCGTKQD